MLNPNERQLYLEALQPPNGYSLDRGIAATYSLDLLTLLIVPLSLVLYDYAGEDDLNDQTKMLEALQRTSEKLRIYCQRGRISVPKINSLLYSYLEDTVVEVDTLGTFHPKTWLLRFTAEELPVIYRFICLSRNLTFDQSWDTLLVLDGQLQGSTMIENKPLLDYLQGLQYLAGKPEQNLDVVWEELSRVKFETPSGFNRSLKFWPLGIDGYKKNPLLRKADRLLIISPFVSDNLLRDVLEKSGANSYLISRIDSLDQLQEETLSLFERSYVMDDPAVDETNAEDVESNDNSRSDLHAKLYISEKGNTTKVFTGSANATNAAFYLNTELLVELTTDNWNMNIDEFLSSDKNLFGSVIKEYRRGELKKIDIEKAKLEALTDKLRDALSNHHFSLNVVPGDEKGTYKMEMACDKGLTDLLSEAKATCWPITLQSSMAKEISEVGEESIISFNLSTAALTSFMAFEITAYQGDLKNRVRFVLNLPIEGLPEDRYEKVLLSIISDRNRFLRYLIMLLAEGKILNPDFIEIIKSGSNNGKPTGDRADNGLPLMEEMIRALSRTPDKIDRIDRLVRELSKTEEGREVLPEDFNLIWGPIWETRQRMVSKK
ncbi:MAG: phospholipase D family protein [Bacillota bacterium]|nr:phospholipase D family protein [Bacillota bacterium]